jgi:hypothetical protein
MVLFSCCCELFCFCWAWYLPAGVQRIYLSGRLFAPSLPLGVCVAAVVPMPEVMLMVCCLVGRYLHLLIFLIAYWLHLLEPSWTSRSSKWFLFLCLNKHNVCLIKMSSFCCLIRCCLLKDWFCWSRIVAFCVVGQSISIHALLIKSVFGDGNVVVACPGNAGLGAVARLCAIYGHTVHDLWRNVK